MTNLRDPKSKVGFLAEKSSVRDNVFSRIWNPVPQNVSALKGVEGSKLLHTVGRDGLRAI